MDADETATHGPSMEVLDTYCDRVASAVGRLSVRVFADGGQAAQQVATSLGRALQLTNILRDIAEDTERDRLYLPADLLDKFGIETRDPTEVMQHEALPSMRCLGGGGARSLRRCHNRHGGVLPTTHAASDLNDARLPPGSQCAHETRLERLEKACQSLQTTKLRILIRHGFF